MKMLEKTRKNRKLKQVRAACKKGSEEVLEHEQTFIRVSSD